MDKQKLNITESASNYQDLDKMSTLDLLTGINQEDAKVHQAVKAVIPTLTVVVDQIVERMQKGGRVFYIGAGTSGRLGVLDASELPPTFGVTPDQVFGLIAGGDSALRKAVEHAEDDRERAWIELQDLNVNITNNDTLVGIAASGTTPYVIGGIETARKAGLMTVSISCNPDSPLSKAAEYAIEAVVGPEFVTGSTRMKAGTAQKLILNMLSTSLMIKMGRVKGNKMVNMQLTNKKLVERGTRMLIDELGLPENEARSLLLKHGSVKKVIEIMRK